MALDSSDQHLLDNIATHMCEEMQCQTNQLERQTQCLQDIRDALRHIALCATDLAATNGQGSQRCDAYDQFMTRVRGRARRVAYMWNSQESMDKEQP